MFGSFSGAGLGFGVAFTLVDRFTQNANQINRAMQGLEQHTMQFQSRVSGAMTKIGIGAMVAGAGVALLSPFIASLNEASDLAESTSKASVVFGEHFRVVNEFAKNTAGSFGLSRQAAFEAAGTYGNLFTSLGLGREMAADYSVSLVKLASDLASFNNTDINSALQAIRSGMSGESEPLKKYGVAINEVTLKQTALSKGLIKSLKDQMSPAVKMQAIYALLMEQTKNAQGDFIRTGDGYANMKRKVEANSLNLKASLGQALLPIATLFAKTFQKILNWMDRFAQTPLGKVIMNIVVAFGALLVVVGLAIAAFGLYQIVTAGLTFAFYGLAPAIWAAISPLLPFIAIGALVVGIIVGIVYAVKRLGKHFEEVGSKNNFFVMLSNMGSILRALWQAWTSFNSATQTFELEGALADKLQKLGILDFTMGLISWLIRIKAFFEGVWNGMVEGFRFLKQVVSEVWGYIKPTVISFFESMGIHLNRNMSKLSSWATVGKWVGYIIIGVLAAIAIAFALMAVAAIIALSPLLLIVYAIYKAIMAVKNSFIGKGIGKAWDWITGGKDSKDGMSDSPIGGNPLDNNNPVSPFNNPVSPLMAMNAKGKANQQTNTPIMMYPLPQEQSQTPIINQFIVDGEPLYSKLMDRNEIEKSRK